MRWMLRYTCEINGPSRDLLFILALPREQAFARPFFRASNLISADHVSIVTCKVPYLISLPFLIDPIFFHPRPPKPKNVAYFPFFDVHAWCCLYLFGPTSRETPLILSLSLLSSSLPPSFSFSPLSPQTMIEVDTLENIR